ncbi:M18 family aminopeptidase [Proteiniclasticum sp. C24MP]|uniref:M18 family aminopeptidase n=1 Tax=Proteiniclasticum sp. C24MP TaxID=3374101 RepID=UPI0037548C56
MEERKLALDLIDFLHDSSTAFQAVDVMKKDLMKQGYKELKGEEDWTLQEGDKAFYIKNNSSLFMVQIGKDPLTNGFKMAGAHTDSPTFRIKPDAEILQDGFMKLNVETYGGPILSTWFDRPLSLAGRVMLKGKSIMKPQTALIDFGKPILYIPSLAIHMNRKVNEGVEVNKQKHVLPVIMMAEKDFEKKGFLKNLVAKELQVDVSEILDFDLFVYEVEKGSLVGFNEEFISSKRQDNLSSVHSIFTAMKSVEEFSGINLGAFFDNEECGSATKQGADSTLLRDLMERIFYGLGGSREDFLKNLEKSFMISADLAHSVHPNYTEMHDPTSRPIINKGPVMKISANMRYTSDADSMSVFAGLCEEAGVPYQYFVNRSDLAGGSTIGPIGSTHLPIRTLDIGNPLLGMHSARELGGVKDHLHLTKALKVYFNLK